MKIVQFLPDLGIGGGQRFVVDLSNELAKNHQVYLITMFDSEKFEFYHLLDKKVSVIGLGKSRGFDFKIIFRLYRTIKNIQPDIIHSHLRAFSYLLPLVPFFKRIKFAFTIHNDAFKECPSPKQRKIRNFFFKKFVKPVTISDESSDSFEKAYPGAVYKQIYNGRERVRKTKDFDKTAEEVNQFKQNDETIVFVNIGRLHPQKNQEMLVSAFGRLVNEDNANAALIIVGGADHTERTIQIERKLKEAKKNFGRIMLTGDRYNATDFLFLSNFFCLSSVYEGMPIVLIEAMAAGTVPICTPVGGVTEMVSGIAPDLLSKSTDEEDFYQALKNAYNMSAEDYEKHRLQSVRNYEEKYSIERCGENHIQLYKELINKK